MLVAGQFRGIHHALPRGGLGARNAADLPQTRRGLAKERRPLRGHQSERSRNPGDGKACESQPVHARLFTTGSPRMENDKFDSGAQLFRFDREAR